MQFTLNSRSALFIMRHLRGTRTLPDTTCSRTDLIPPDPAPLRRWGKSCFAVGAHPTIGLLQGQQTCFAVPREDHRVRANGARSTIYRTGLPHRSFLDIDDGAAISSPELLFAEMANLMHPVEHVMLGLELCGTFSRNPLDPYNAPVVYDVPPLTDVGRISSFLEEAKDIRGIKIARSRVKYLNNNAWSPTESLIAALMRLPIDDLGYGIGELILNPRVVGTHDLPGSLGSRVPDILISDTSVGVNYDGLVHLDLDSIAKAGIDLGLNPGSSHTEFELSQAVSRVRAKAADDIRRNRELAAEGMTVFPLLKEDLYEPGGLDRMMGAILDVLQDRHGWDVRQQRRSIKLKALCEERHRMILSLLPGKAERDIQVAHFIQGLKVSEEPAEMIECWIEL